MWGQAWRLPPAQEAPPLPLGDRIGESRSSGRRRFSRAFLLKATSRQPNDLSGLLSRQVTALLPTFGKSFAPLTKAACPHLTLQKHKFQAKAPCFVQETGIDKTACFVVYLRLSTNRYIILAGL